MRIRLAALVIACCMTAVYPAGARDVFVDNTKGDDLRDGATPFVQGKAGGPCRSIHRALELAGNGDRIVLLPSDEPYRESITLQAGRHSGIPGRPFELVGNGAVLDGSQPVPGNVWKHVQGTVFRFRAARKAFHLLFLDGRPAVRQPLAPGGVLPELAPLQWCLHEGHVYFCTDEGKLPRQYDLSHTVRRVGITIYESRHVVIRDLTVQGFQLDGINAHDSVFDAALVGLTCRGNGRSGISVGGSSRVQIIACLVGDNGDAQVRTEGFSRTEIINCDLLDNTAPALVREGGVVTVSGSQPGAATP